MSLVTPNQGLRKFHLDIDSANRDRRAYPNPNSYTMELDQEYYGVNQLKLTNAIIPNSMYIIDEHNRYIYFTWIIPNPTSAGEATLRIGDYTPIGLAKELTRALNNPVYQPGGIGPFVPQVFKVTYDDNTNKFTFQVTFGGSVTFLFNSYGNVTPQYPKLCQIETGFYIDEDYGMSGIPATITAPNRINLSGPREVLISIDDTVNNFGYIRRGGSGPSNATGNENTNLLTGQRVFFAAIDLNATPGTLTFFKNNGDYSNDYCFNQGAEKNIKRLNVSFWIERNRTIIPYNFRGIGHTLTFEINAHLDKTWSKSYKRNCY